MPDPNKTTPQGPTCEAETRKQTSTPTVPQKAEEFNPTVTRLATIIDKTGSHIPLRMALREIQDGTHEDVVTAISRESDKKRRAELKRQLPAFQFSGIFNGRGDDALSVHSGIICADLDGVPCDTIDATAQALRTSPHVVSVFRSPSFTGLKALVRVEASVELHKRSFNAVAAHIKELTGLEVDPSGKNPERLCYASASAASWNPSATILPPAVEAPKPAPPALPLATVRTDPSGKGGFDMETRKRIAHALLGNIDWNTETDGFCSCPGKTSHTNPDGPQDCKVSLDGAPTVHCFHSSCSAVVADLNRKLRSEIGKAEAPVAQAIRLHGSKPEGLHAQMLEVWGQKLSARERNELLAGIVADDLLARGELYHDKELRDFDSAMFFDHKTKRLELIRSHAFQAWLSDHTRLLRTANEFKAVAGHIETLSLGRHSTAITPESFWTTRPGCIYLSNGAASIVRVSANSVALVDNGTDGVLFSSGAVLQPWRLIEPADPFSACSVFRGINTTSTGALTFRLWVLSLPTKPKSKPPLCLAGTVGSGKTRVLKGVAELYGVPWRPVKVESDAEGDFWPTVNRGGLVVLDNADTRTRWLQDALANAATDGCSEKRQLYTNAGTVVLRPHAWVAITTANASFASDAGLADRLLPVRMSRREGETADGELTAQVLAARDAGLSWVASVLSKALADTEPTPPNLNQRHPDFAELAIRIARALGCEDEAVAALRDVESDKARFCLENHPIGSALLAAISIEPFYGNAAALAERLNTVDPELELTPKKVGKRLESIWPHVQSVFPGSKVTDDGHANAKNYRIRP